MSGFLVWGMGETAVLVLTALYNGYIILGMDALTISLREVDMSLVRSKQSLDLIRTAYEGNEEAELVLTSYQLRKPQKDMIKGLAKQSAMHQAAVLRAILDEWCEMKMSEQ